MISEKNKGEKEKIKIEPYMMTILVKKLEIINTEMINTILRSGRSGVICAGRDFSCSIVDGKGRLLFVNKGLPIHCANMDYVAQSVLELFKGDIHEGDDFLNNSPYYGNTHHADHTHIVPVFYEGELMFFTIARGHQADCGNSIPTTYFPQAKDIYEEGALDFPAVRVQRNYKDIKDLIRMIKMRIRVPDQWYGDYLAQVGACRVGEQRLKELCATYGKDYIKAFIEAYMDYGESCIITEIKKFPKMHLEYESKHDPIPGVPETDDGIPIRMKIDIDPDAGYIYTDVTHNIDSLPCGVNMCRATTRAAAVQGILSNINPVPYNDGVFKHLPVKMAEGKAVGYTKHPGSMSTATTNLCDRLANLSLAIFEKIGPTKGVAECGLNGPAALSVISGTDFRQGGKSYCNQILGGGGSGGALYNHDGFLTWDVPAAGGITGVDSIEIDEQKYPIMFKCRCIKMDSGGPGRWRGAPSKHVEFVQRRMPGQWIYFNDGGVYPAKGIHGGMRGGEADVWKYKISSLRRLWDYERDKGIRRIDLPLIASITLQPETEVLVSVSSAGGGFGDPLERDPEKVRWDVREGYVSLDAARSIYGVVLDTKPELYKVDYEATKELRRGLREERRVSNEF